MYKIVINNDFKENEGEIRSKHQPLKKNSFGFYYQVLCWCILYAFHFNQPNPLFLVNKDSG